MEQKRCISVASRGMTRETRKRGNGDDEWGTKNIYPADAPNLPSIFQQWLDSSKEVHLHHTLRCLSASQRSTLRWMISYGLMTVPADWLSARSVSVERAYTVHNVNRRACTVERRCGASWFVAVGLSEAEMTNTEWKCQSLGMCELPLNLSKRDSSSQKSACYVCLFLTMDLMSVCKVRQTHPEIYAVPLSSTQHSGFCLYSGKEQYSTWAFYVTNENEYSTNIPVYMQPCILQLT